MKYDLFPALLKLVEIVPYGLGCGSESGVEVVIEYLLRICFTVPEQLGRQVVIDPVGGPIT